MTPEAENILAECFRRQPDVEPSRVPYSAGLWFGAIPEHQRQRYRRAIDRLACEGLLETVREHGRRLSHLQLTDAGAVRAYALLKAQTSDTGALPASTTASAGTLPTSQPCNGELN